MKQNIIHSRKINLFKSIIFAVQSARGADVVLTASRMGL